MITEEVIREQFQKYWDSKDRPQVPVWPLESYKEAKEWCFESFKAACDWLLMEIE